MKKALYFSLIAMLIATVALSGCGGGGGGNNSPGGSNGSGTIRYIFEKSWGSEGDGDGQFDSPWGVGVDSKGNVYVADWYGHRIQKFSADGTFLTKWGSFGYGDGQFEAPCGIAVDSDGNVYVTDVNYNRIQKFKPVVE